MDKLLLNIEELYQNILDRRTISEQVQKLHLLGGSSCKWGGGPYDHAKLGVTDWTAKRAWDIQGQEGANVNSISNGVITDIQQKNYNKETNEYGYSVTINTDGDVVYYTHLSSVGPKRKGEKISQGEFIGKIGKPKEDPNWPSHVHIALQSGDIKNYVDTSCNLIKKTTTGNNTSQSGTSTTPDVNLKSQYYYGNEKLGNIMSAGLKTESKEFIKEVEIIAPVPVKPGFKSNFGQKRSYEVHPGVDIGVPVGTQVLSPMDGVVELADFNNNKLCGATIDIDYGNGFWSRFCHMSRIDVKKGDVVKQGQVVGLSGGKVGAPGAGNSKGPHLHYTLKKNGQKVDPIEYINKTVEPGKYSIEPSNDDEISGEVDYSSVLNSMGSSQSTKSPLEPQYYYGNKEFANLLTKPLEVLKSLKNEMKESSNYSGDLMGGSTVKIPHDGGHSGQKGWANSNAWDIPTPIGTPIYAITSGKVITFTDYGPNVIKKNGKKLFGVGFTVDSDNSLPDVYYTHLKNPQVKKGDKVECGQILGYVMDFPGSSYDHLHIALESGNIRKFIDTDGKLKCMKGVNLNNLNFNKDFPNITPEKDLGLSSSEVSPSNYEDVIKSLGQTSDTKSKYFYGNKEFADILTQPFKSLMKNEMKEDKIYGEFGKEQKSNYGSITLPKDKNSKIKSPVSGKIVRGKYNSDCKNQIYIEHEVEGEKYYLEYCGISKPDVNIGNSISKGGLLGKTDTDVTISLFDSSNSRVYIDSYIKKEIDKTKKLEKKGIKREPKIYYDTPWGQIMGNLLVAPVKVFQDKYDEYGNLKQKRWGSPTDTEQPENWISQMSPTSSKKLKEQIERIKKIL